MAAAVTPCFLLTNQTVTHGHTSTATQVCLCNSSSGGGGSCPRARFLITHIDPLAFIVFGSGTGLLGRGPRAQNFILLAHKHTRAPHPRPPCNAGDVNIWVFARSCDQSTLFIRPCCCRPSGGVITRGRTQRTHTGSRHIANGCGGGVCVCVLGGVLWLHL